MLSIDNTEPLIDEIINIRGEGLVPGEDLTLRVETSVGHENPVYFHSFGHFRADEKGNIDLSKHSPINGTYSTVDSMGLFWSIEEISGQSPGSRIFQRDSRQPVKMNLELYNGFVDFNVPIESLHEVVKHSSLVQRIALKRWYLSKNVDRHEVKSGRLRGTLFVPKNHNGPMAGIIDLFGTSGGLTEFRAALLASHGFVTLALAYFVHEDLPEKLEDIEIEYFEEAVDWLGQHPNVRQGAVGMIGTSKGGELSMLTACRKHEVKAVVGINCPYFHMVSGVKINGQHTGYVPCSSEKLKVSPEGFVSMLEAWVHPEDIYDVATIPVETMKAQLLLLSCEDDQAIPSVKCASAIKKRMEQFGRGNQCRVVKYPKAGHLLHPPFMPLYVGSSNKTSNAILHWGGEKEEHAFAQKDAWERLLEFCKEAI